MFFSEIFQKKEKNPLEFSEETANLKNKRLVSFLRRVHMNDSEAIGSPEILEKFLSAPPERLVEMMRRLDGDLMSDRIEYAPLPEYDNRYSQRKNSHFYKYVY